MYRSGYSSTNIVKRILNGSNLSKFYGHSFFLMLCISQVFITCQKIQRHINNKVQNFNFSKPVTLPWNENLIYFYDFLWFYSFHRLPKWMWRFKTPTPERKNYLNNWWSLVYFVSFGSRVFDFFFVLLVPQFFLYFTTKYIPLIAQYLMMRWVSMV